MRGQSHASDGRACVTEFIKQFSIPALARLVTETHKAVLCEARQRKTVRLGVTRVKIIPFAIGTIIS